MNLEWPQIFQNASLIEKIDERNLCAQGLTAWAMVYGQIGGEIPDNFGEVMAEVAVRLGVSGTADSLSAHAREQGWIA